MRPIPGRAAAIRKRTCSVDTVEILQRVVDAPSNNPEFAHPDASSMIVGAHKREGRVLSNPSSRMTGG
jgi:hypothetical protein